MEEEFNDTLREQPTESQVEVLMSDWLGNLRLKDEGNFTHAGKGGIRHHKNESFSDYLVGDVESLTPLDLLKQGRLAARQVVNSIVPEQTEVMVGGQTSFHVTDDRGRHIINLATDYFDDDSLTPRQKIDVMLGLASHEGAHAVFTDRASKDKMLAKEPAQTKELKHQIWNIIEDERIEYLLGDERPGLAQTLGETKRYFFKQLVQDMRVQGQLPTEPLPKLLSALTQAVRYPSELTREEVVENFDELDAIRKALTPYPLTPEDTLKATNRVMNIVKRIIKDELEQEQQQSPGDQQQQNGQNGQNQPQGGQQDPNGQQDPQGGQNPQNGPQNGQQGQKPGPSEKDILDAIQKALQTEQGQKVMEALKKDAEKADGSNASSEIAGDSTQSDYVNQDDAECVGGGPGDPRTFLFKPKGSAQAYNSTLAKVRKYIPAMSKALACKSRDTHYVLHGLPEGKLNTNKLVALKCGNTAIFDKKGEITCSSASVVMLIDESGSMCGEKELRAREAAILVNETIARIKNVHFYCYGYTDDRLTVYAENGRTSKWALSATGSYGGTPTGDAMRLSAKRVRSFTNEPVLMLVLTDGSADDNRKVVKQDEVLRGNGFIPIGVGIQTSYVKHSFKEYVVVQDISTFAMDLGRLTKGKLDKMLVRQSA